MTRKPASPRPDDADMRQRGILVNDPLDWIGADPEAETAAAEPEAAAFEPAPVAAKPRLTPAKAAAPVEPWDDMSTFAVLELLSNPMMVADENLVIRFVNEAAFAMFERIEGAIREDLPRFRARQVIGQNIDVFHKNPAYQRRLMDGMTKPHDGRFSIGGAHLGFRATPKNNPDGSIACIFVEWSDRTAEVEARGDLAAMVDAVRDMSRAHMEGDIEVKIDTDRFRGELRDTLSLVNNMVQEHIDTNRKVINCMVQFAGGDFDAPLERFPGKKAFINDAMETIRANFRSLVRDVGTMAQDLAEGMLDSRVDSSAHRGEFRRLIDTIDTIRLNFRNVTSEIDRLSRAIVAGELDVETKPQDFKGAYRQLIEAFEQAFTSLNGAFRLIGQQVQQVSATVGQMTQSSQALATNSQIQSSSVDEVSSSAEQTDIQVKSNATAATTASQLVTGASEVAEGGKAKINEMVQAMEGIRSSSQDIAKIIKVIDEIAFQTNLLALNAAVEAARAGQHGRGFAVVAQEVRNLAGRSAKAARETSDLIEDAATRVQAGVKIADETSRAFVSIADDITQVKTLVRDIAIASDEQSRGVAQINVAIGEVAKSALATSQQAEELAASAAEMQAATESMLAEVGRFRLRSVAAPAAMMSGMGMAGLPPALMAQIQAMIMQQTAHSAGTAVTQSSNRDMRGYGGF